MRRLALHVALLCAVPCAAQQRSVNDGAVWGAVFGDHRFGTKSSLYWDYQPRRAEEGRIWQLNLGAVGYTRDLSPQWRATVALGSSYSYPYGPLAPRINAFELRPWMQVTGRRAAGSWTWSDRSRVEFRVLRPTGEFAPADADWAPTVVRVRRQDRFERSITANNRWYAAASQEFMLNVHPARSRVPWLEQSRTQFLIGRQVTPRNRIETGYGLQRVNRRAGHELNHTLLVYFRTTVPFR